MERPNPDPDFLPDPVPESKERPARPVRQPNAPKVIPLDEDKNLEKGIEIKET